MEKQLKNDFEKIIKKTNFSKENVLIKKDYLNKFIESGFPNRKNEDWKFSDISQIIKKNIGELDFYTDYETKNKIDTSIYIKELQHNKIVFINGKIEKIDFESEDKNKIEILNECDFKNNFKYENSLINLNNAFNNRYYKLIVKENCSINRPIIVYQITNEELHQKNINVRIDYKLEKNSSLKLIDFSSDRSDKNFINIVNNFELERDSVLKNYKLDKQQNNNIKYFYNNIDQKSNSVSETFILSNGSRFIKHEINCNLEGEYASAFVNGIMQLQDRQHHEIRTSINHLINNTKSYQLIKSVLNDYSKSAYQGKIFVNSEAQKTDGYQLSKAILLNENSEFNAKPELEIYADDVKCSHGSASGDLNQDSIFYMMSRGLNYKEAKQLLINGFLLDVVEKITDLEIKNLIKGIMEIKE